MVRSFTGGVNMEEYKEFTSGKKVFRPGQAPKTVTIALSQHIGVECKPLVKKGDRVLVGQKIGQADANMSVPVHSSVSGEVLEIKTIAKADGSSCKAIVIENDGLDELGYEKLNRDWKTMSPGEILSYIKEAGAVGLGGAGFPSHIKLSPPKDSPIDTVLVNGAECEPFLTADQKIMEMAAEDIVQGLEIVLKTVNASKGIICIEDNKPEAIEKMKAAVASNANIEVLVMETKYPQGDEKRIIDTALGRQVPKGGLPMSVGVVVINVYSLKTIHDAVVNGKPLYERIVTVTGPATKDPQNLLVRNGVSLAYLFEQAGGFKEEPGKVIVGGPMMGMAQYSLDLPIVKATGAVIALNKDQARQEEETACIACARCVDVCPVFLQPAALNKMVRNNHFDTARNNHIDACIQCGSCSFVCPAKINLAESIKIGMLEVKKIKARV